MLGSVATVAANDFNIVEARVGAGVVDLTWGEQQAYYNYDLPALNAEVLFKPIDLELGFTEGVARELLTPRPHLGTTISLDDYSPSSVYAGLTWHQPLGERFFLEGSFGGALHNGKMEKERISATKWKRGLGSPILFRESISIGINLTETMTAVLALSHMSHAGLAGDENAGQTDLFLKIGQKF